jgi:hypothetical protein
MVGQGTVDKGISRRWRLWRNEAPATLGVCLPFLVIGARTVKGEPGGSGWDNRTMDTHGDAFDAFIFDLIDYH